MILKYTIYKYWYYLFKTIFYMYVYIIIYTSVGKTSWNDDESTSITISIALLNKKQKTSLALYGTSRNSRSFQNLLSQHTWAPLAQAHHHSHAEREGNDEPRDGSISTMYRRGTSEQWFPLGIANRCALVWWESMRFTIVFITNLTISQGFNRKTSLYMCVKFQKSILKHFFAVMSFSVASLYKIIIQIFGSLLSMSKNLRDSIACSTCLRDWRIFNFSKSVAVNSSSPSPAFGAEWKPLCEESAHILHI